MAKKKDTRDRRAYLKEYYRKNKEKAKAYCFVNREKRNAYVKEWRLKNKEWRQEYYSKYNKEYYQKNKEVLVFKNKEYFKNNKDKIRKVYSKNKEHRNKVRREWAKKNPEKVALMTAKRKVVKMQAMPKWLTEEQIKEIEMFYIEATELRWLNENQELHVDHIIPLRHPDVCGLHVPWNLQILSGSLNCKKSNKFDGTYENKSWSK